MLDILLEILKRKDNKLDRTHFTIEQWIQLKTKNLAKIIKLFLYVQSYGRSSLNVFFIIFPLIYTN